MSHTSKRNSISIISWNANSIKGKILELRAYVKDKNPDILLLQETHLRPSDSLSIPNYITYRNDRLTHRGGGTAICVRNGIQHHLLHHSASSFEATVIEVAARNNKFHTVASIYKPPLNHLITSDLEDLAGFNEKFILYGDFNCRHPTWNRGSSNRDGNLLFNFSQVKQYEVVAPSTSTFSTIRGSSILDIGVVNGLLPSEITSEAALSSDHNPIVLKIHDSSFLPTTETKIRITNWRKFHDLLSLSVPGNPSIASPLDVDIAIQALTNAILTAREQASRYKTIFNARKNIPPDLVALIKHKNKIRKTWQSTGYPPYKAELNRLQRVIKSELAAFSNKSWSDFLSTLSTEDGSLFKINKKLVNKFQPVPPLSLPDQTTPPATTDFEKAEMFGKALADTFKPNAHLSVPINDINVYGTTTAFLHCTPPTPAPFFVTPAEVADLIKKAKKKKAPGPDTIDIETLQAVPVNITTNITKIINSCLRLNYFPDDWKKANVIMIHKPGQQRSHPSSYRPISLLNSLSKMLEKIVLQRLLAHSEENNILPPEQFGFRAKHSTVHQLLRITNAIAAGFKNNRRTGAVFLDVAKAFDRVWHDGLIYKLIAFKFPAYLIRLINSFLKNRSFRVRVGSDYSTPFPITAGTPQGAILSPLLFNIFTADIPKTQNTYLHLFADDTAVVAQSTTYYSVCCRLQKALNNIENWCRTWKIAVNTSKTQAIMFKRRKKNHHNDELTLFQDNIKWSKSVKYLGVHFDENINFKAHVDKTIDKYRMKFRHMYPLICKKSSLTLNSKILLFKMILRPLITYAAPIWATTAKTNIKKLALLQNKLLRMATGAPWYISTSNLQQELRTESLIKFIEKSAKNFFITVDQHPNSLISVQSIMNDANPNAKFPFATTQLSARIF